MFAYQQQRVRYAMLKEQQSSEVIIPYPPVIQFCFQTEAWLLPLNTPFASNQETTTNINACNYGGREISK